MGKQRGEGGTWGNVIFVEKVKNAGEKNVSYLLFLKKMHHGVADPVLAQQRLYHPVPRPPWHLWALSPAADQLDLFHAQTSSPAYGRLANMHPDIALSVG